ncbi:MAG: ABC-2 transporter permease [Eubacterium sp.]|nr:ABC-2 transporter permease [Eubacterium sp.]
MKGLIYKDIFLNKSKIIFTGLSIVTVVALMFIFFKAAGKTPEDMSPAALVIDLMIVLYIGNMNSGYIMKTDTSRPWGFYGVALPRTERSVVGAKYLIVLLLYAIAFILCEINDIVCGLVDGSIDSNRVITLILIFCNLLVFSIETPIAFRLGVERASIVRIFISVILTLIVTIYLLFGNIEWLMGENGIVRTILTEVVKDNPDTAVYAQGIADLKDKIGLISFVVYLIEIIFVGLMYFLSYQISCAVFKKGILRDDI